MNCPTGSRQGPIVSDDACGRRQIPAALMNQVVEFMVMLGGFMVIVGVSVALEPAPMGVSVLTEPVSAGALTPPSRPWWRRITPAP